MDCVGRRISIVVFSLMAMCLSAIAQDRDSLAGLAPSDGFAIVQNRNSITGFVFGDDRAPVQRLNIELQTELYSTVARTKTNGSGMYAFHGLPSGNYLVKILTSGTDFEEQSRSVSLVPISVMAGRGTVSEQVDFYLKLKRKPSELQGRGGVIFAQDVPKNAEELYQAGIKDLENKKEADGFGKLKQAIEAFPDYFVALDRLAIEYLRKGHFEAAYVLYTHAVRVNPRSISSGLGLGMAEYRMNRLDKSIEAFNEVLKLDKENANAYYWKGVVLHASRKFGDALAALQRADKLGEGKVADVHFQLARVYKDQNKFRESAESLEAFLRLKPDAENAPEIREIIKTLREKHGS